MLLCFAADTPTVRPPVNHSEQQQPAHGSGCGRRAIWPTARSAPLCAPAAERATRPSACKEREINVFLSLTVCSRHLARGTGGSEDWEWALPGRYWPPGPEFPGTPCPHLPGVRDPETAWTCLGAKGRRPISSREEDPQTSLPSLPPLKKRVKKKKNPTHGERRLGLAGLCSRALHGSVTRLWLPVRALSQAPRSLERPWRGFSRVRSRHSRPSREGATGPREAPSFLLSGGSAGRSRTLLPPLPRSLSRETRRAPRRKFFSGSWKEAGREEPGRWMLLSCAAHASRERSAPGRAESLEDCSPQPEGGRGERSCPAAGAEEAAGRPAAAQAMPLRPLRHGWCGAWCVAIRTRTPAGLQSLDPRPRFGLGECGAAALGGLGRRGGRLLAGRAGRQVPFWGAARGPGRRREGRGERGRPPRAARPLPPGRSRLGNPAGDLPPR